MHAIRKNFYLISITILIVFVGVIIIFRQKEPDVPPLQDRIGGIASGSEWLNTKQAIDGLIERVRKNPDDLKLKIQLAQGYVQEARITGNYNYYDLACIKLLNKVLEKEPKNFEALVTLATVYLSQHHFKEGLELGLKAQKISPHASYVYGVLTDAYVELGKYDSAVLMVDTMCGIRPDLRSYSRVSYVREIYGDIPGSIDAMKMAVDAGLPGLEQTEWVRVYLGKLYEMTGNIDTAEYYYKLANAIRPNYAYAIAGLGRIEMIKKNYPQAIKYYETANSLVNDYSFGDELIDLYRLNNQNEKSDSIAKVVISDLNAQSNSDDSNPDAGHYTDKELAYVYLKTGDVKNALKHAQAEYSRRPDNIEINELMGWVTYKQGNFTQAIPYMEKAMRTGCVNPVLLCHAGLIYCKANQTAKGTSLLQQAFAMNPYMSNDLLQEAQLYLSKPAQVAAS